MNTERFRPALAAGLAALACACAATEPVEPVPAVAEPVSVAAAADPAGVEPVDAATSADVDAAEPAVRATSGFELGIWNDPAYRRWFIRSYAAETEVEPRVTVIEREQLEEIYELFAEDELDEAREYLEGMRGDGRSATVDFMLGNVYMQQDRLEDAAAAYGVATAKFERFRRAYKMLGVARLQLEDHDGAVEAFTRAIQNGANDGYVYGMLGVCYVNGEDYLAGESALRMATILDPGTRDWKLHLARALFRQQRYADAVALSDALIAEAPHDPTMWLMQANAYIGLGRPLEAAENYEMVDSLGGSTVDSLNNLGDIYINQELHDLAVASYVRALEMDPEAPVERSLQAALVMAMRNALDSTRELLARIEELRGESLGFEDRKSVLRLKAQLALAEGAGDEEARVLEEVVALDPLDGRALIQLGDHAAAHDDPEQAVFYYERAAGIEEFEADANVQHAQLLVRQGRFAEALPLLERAQSIERRGNVQDFLDLVKRRMGSG